MLIISAVKTISLFYGQGDGRNGAQVATETTARLKIHRGQKSAALTRLGMDLIRDQTGWWEQLVFLALWLSGLFSVGYCLKAVL